MEHILQEHINAIIEMNRLEFDINENGYAIEIICTSLDKCTDIQKNWCHLMINIEKINELIEADLTTQIPIIMNWSKGLITPGEKAALVKHISKKCGTVLLYLSLISLNNIFNICNMLFMIL